MTEREILDLWRQCQIAMRQKRGERPTQERILYLLYKHKAMTQKDLLRYIPVKQATLSEMISKLTNYQLIRKEKDPMDLRRTVLSLTTEGRKLAEDNHARYLAMDEGLLEVLTTEDQETLGRILKSLYENWQVAKNESIF